VVADVTRILKAIDVEDSAQSIELPVAFPARYDGAVALLPRVAVKDEHLKVALWVVNFTAVAVALFPFPDKRSPVNRENYERSLAPKPLLRT
jgi:hypothetical protein